MLHRVKTIEITRRPRARDEAIIWQNAPMSALGQKQTFLGQATMSALPLKAAWIHGTNAPETIGQAVSSGCFRLVNDDVADLYDRVSVGTHVIVRQN